MNADASPTTCEPGQEWCLRPSPAMFTSGRTLPARRLAQTCRRCTTKLSCRWLPPARVRCLSTICHVHLCCASDPWRVCRSGTWRGRKTTMRCRRALASARSSRCSVISRPLRTRSEIYCEVASPCRAAWQIRTARGQPAWLRQQVPDG